MPAGDDSVRSITIGGARRRGAVLGVLAVVAVGLVALAWPDPPEEAPAPVLPTAEAFPPLAGQHLLVRSRIDLLLDLGTGTFEPAPSDVEWAPATVPTGVAFSPDGGHVGYYGSEQGDGVTLWRITVLELATGELRTAGPRFHTRFVVADGGRYVLSPLPEGVVVADTETGELTSLALRVPVEDVRLYD